MQKELGINMSFENRAKNFWDSFAESESELQLMENRLLDALQDKLCIVHPDLSFEIGLNCNPKEFIVTANRRKELFPTVERLVSLAPIVQNWIFIALKPVRGFEFNLTYKHLDYDPSKMWFLPLSKRGASRITGFRIGVVNKPLNDQNNLEAIETIIETAIGERLFASYIEHLEVVELPKEPEKKGYIELYELHKYLIWRSKKDVLAGNLL